MRITTVALASLLALGFASRAEAQFTQINPNGAGGYLITTPGQPMTTINPNGAGGYLATTPGQPMTTINPNGMGGYNAMTPMQTMPVFNGGYYQPYR